MTRGGHLYNSPIFKLTHYPIFGSALHRIKRQPTATRGDAESKGSTRESQRRRLVHLHQCNRDVQHRTTSTHHWRCRYGVSGTASGRNKSETRNGPCKLSSRCVRLNSVRFSLFCFLLLFCPFREGQKLIEKPEEFIRIGWFSGMPLVGQFVPQRREVFDQIE